MKYFRYQIAITVKHTDNEKWKSIPFVIQNGVKLFLLNIY